jgi:hypothetical protein
MMRFFLSLLFFILFFSGSSYSQNTEKQPAEMVADTIEGISTDSTIVYIIKKPAVTIREKFEIELAKRKKYFHVSMGLSGLVYSEKYSATKGHENYTETVKKSSRPLSGYGINIELWQAPKKLITGVSIGGIRILEQFNIQDNLGHNYSSKNSFTYGNIALVMGWWFKKENKISFQLLSGPSLDYIITDTGHAFDKTNTQNTTTISQSISYRPYTVSFNAGIKMLYRLNKSYIEVEPYMEIAPFSTTVKKEYYTLTRNFYGVKVNLMNKLYRP